MYSPAILVRILAPLAGALLIGALAPASAHAQVTAHKLKISVKGLGQTVNDANDLKPDSFNANAKDLFEICTGSPPANDEGIYLFLDCEDLDNNMIAAIDTDPLTLLEEIGSIDFDLGNLVVKEKGGELKSATVPASIEVDCGEAALSAQAIIDVAFKALDSATCPNTANGKMIGVGSEDEDFIVDQGSSLNAAKRAAAISTFPPEP